MFKDATPEEVNLALQKAWNAFAFYRNFSLHQRAAFMKAIAIALEESGDELITTAMRETNLPEARLRGERARTIFQLNSYADACEKGDWLEARIDTANASKTPPKPDIRKMLVPLGPVVVFGASNFPLAYSTAGGDTACAFAAGCPVVVKAHPAHPATSLLVAKAIESAAAKCKMPEGIFTHLFGTGFETGKELVTHPLTKAVGFTGSYAGGKQLFDWANQRKRPIPVFAEMGSINPVFLLPQKLNNEAGFIANLYAQSITVGVGQFCTNPGLIIGIESEALDSFISSLGKAIAATEPATLLHPGISKAFYQKRATALSQKGVKLIAIADSPPQENQGTPTVATVDGENFLSNPTLHQEVFGPYSIVVRCSDMQQMKQIASSLEGQLTATVMATEQELKENTLLIDEIKNCCGRFIINGIPTGVEVCLSMQHGGPFPASTDSRFTSVGADGIKRFARPLAFQNWPNELLPVELKNENPLNIWRTVNNELTKEKIIQAD